MTGFLTGITSSNFQAEEVDAALAVGVGCTISAFAVIVGAGTILPEQVDLPTLRNVPGWLLLFAIPGVPVFALVGGVGGGLGARYQHRDAA
jgi:hypothetical protein